MTIGEKLTTIARRIPDIFGKGRAVGYQEGYRKGYDNGTLDGGIAGREVCLVRHYVESILGSGSSELTFSVPFAPDFVAINCSNPYSSEIANSYRSILVDFRSCGYNAAYIQYCNSAGQNNMGSLQTARVGEYFSYENGVFRFAPKSNTLAAVRWHENVRYTVTAVRFPEENAQQLVQEQIALLPDTPPTGSTGTLHYSAAAISRYFTEEQWQLLTARKPNWRFVLQ